MQNRRTAMIIGLVISCFLISNSASASFVDVPTDHWAYDAIEFLEGEGLVEGYPDGTFRGDNQLSRYEFAMVVSRIYEAFLDLLEDPDAGHPGIEVEAVLDMLMEEFQAELDEVLDLVESNTARIEELEDTTGDLEDDVGGLEGDVDDVSDEVDSMNDRFSPFGDLRLRFEGKYPDTGLQTQRARYRFRLGFTSVINNELNLRARMASGSRGGLTSTNRTIDDAFGYDHFTIDQAYLQYSPESAPGFTFWGGKFSPPWHTTVLSFDSDVNVEGIAQRFSHNNFDFYLGELIPTVEGFYLIAQAMVEDLGTEGLDAAVTYHYMNEDAWTHIMADMVAGDLKSRFDFSNLDNPTDYRAIEGWGRYSTDINCMPVSIEGSYYQNLQDTLTGGVDWNRAAWARLTLNGKPSEVGDWRLWGEWGRIQANSVLSWLTDADRGSGDHEWLGASWTYRLLSNTDFVLTYLTTDRISIDNAGFDLIQFDFVTKFK